MNQLNDYLTEESPDEKALAFEVIRQRIIALPETQKQILWLWAIKVFIADANKGSIIAQPLLDEVTPIMESLGVKP